MLTTQEKAAIEAYTGPVQKIPPGESGLPTARWDAKHNKLRNAHHCGRFFSREEAKQRFRNGTMNKSSLTHRRQRVAELSKTMTAREIAAHLRLGIHIVRADLQAYGLKAQPIDRTGIGCTEKAKAIAKERRVKVRELFKAGMKKPADITQELGGDRRTIRRDLVRLGLIEGKA